MILPSIEIVPMGELTYKIILRKSSEPQYIDYRVDGKGNVEYDPSTAVKTQESLQTLWQKNIAAGIRPDEARQWMPMGEHGFRYMFWVRYIPSHPLEYRWAEDEEKLRNIYEISRFDYVKPSFQDMDESIYLFGQSCAEHLTYPRIYYNTMGNLRDLKRAAAILNKDNRIAVLRDPVNPRAYFIRFSLHHKDTWHRYNVRMVDGKYNSGSGSIVSRIILSRFQYPYHQLDYTTDLHELKLPDVWGMWNTWNEPPPTHNTTTVWRNSDGTVTTWKGASRRYYFFNVLSIASDIFDESKPGFIPMHRLLGDNTTKCWVRWDHHREKLEICS